MFSEITQKNKLEILGKLTASLSHEVRNPLSAIKLNLDYIKMSEIELPTDISESVDNCITGVHRIEYLIENILNFTRKSRNNYMMVSINEISELAINLSMAKASKEKIKLTSAHSEQMPKIEFDRINLLQVMLNLITNAIEACESRTGKIHIKTFIGEGSFDDKVIWEITDNGVGIKDENKDKIFGDFFTNKEGGTGLGLSVCRELLNEKKASLSFQSDFGKGSTFSIFFSTDLKEKNAQ